MENCYNILGVSETATLNEIKLRYKKLAKELHPDINPSLHAGEKFKSITAAYTVLSNPSLRRQHDSRLSQARLAAMQQHLKRESRRARSTQKGQYKYRPKPTQSAFSSKNEKKANLYAIGFVAAIALLVLLGVNVYNFYQEWKMEERIADFNQQMHQADSLFYTGKTQAALLFVNEIQKKNQSNQYIKRYEINYLNFRREQAERDFKNKAYQDALWGYLFLMQYSKSQNQDLQYKLAICYRHINKPNKAIAILNELMKNNYKRIMMTELIASIYLKEKADTTVALQYYQIGLDNVINQFKSIYGDAYRLLVSAERTPQAYKKIYKRNAELLFESKRYTEAAKLFEWVVFFNPDSKTAYEYLISSYFLANDKKQACSAWRKAEKIDIYPSVSFELNCI